jgi:hypothetical protein
LFRLRPWVWVSLTLLLALGVGAHFLWQRYAGSVAGQPQYRLTADNIHITPNPPWIRSDVKTEALRDTGLIGTVSILDDWATLSRRVKEAFEFHPWVAAVTRIERHLPSSLEVELRYRRPVAAVESSDPSGVVFLPIDENAIRLPEGDLTDAERRYLPRVSGVTGRPLVGDVWGDPRVVGGARLAAALADVWQQLRLVEILATIQAPRSEPQVYTFEIVTTGGTRIVWGTAPGQESGSGESPFEQKRQRIVDYAAQHGQLESIDGPEKLDVRSELIVTPRTARHQPATDKVETQTK